MSEQASSGQPADRRPVGRPPAVTDEELRRVIERLHREGKVVTTTAVQAQIGGARKTIERLMADIGAIDTTINTKSPTPSVVDKAWQQSLAEHSIAIRSECQLKVDKLRDLLQQTSDALLGVEANYDSANADRITARRERDELQGQLAIEREARSRSESELSAIRAQAEAASRAETIAATKLDTALLTIQALEAQAADLTAQRNEAWRERDELTGQLATERKDRARYEAEGATLREQTETSLKGEAVVATKLEALLLTLQTLEAQGTEQQREKTRLQDELARARADAQAASSQAEEHRQDLLRFEEALAVERRVRGEHLEKLYAIVEFLADRNPEAREALTMLDAVPAADKPPTRLSKILEALTGRQPPPLPPRGEDDEAGSSIPF